MNLYFNSVAKRLFSHFNDPGAILQKRHWQFQSHKTKVAKYNCTFHLRSSELSSSNYFSTRLVEMRTSVIFRIVFFSCVLLISVMHKVTIIDFHSICTCFKTLWNAIPS